MTTIMMINHNDDDENRAMKGELVQILRDFLSRVTPELPPVLPIGRQDLKACNQHLLVWTSVNQVLKVCKQRGLVWTNVDQCGLGVDQIINIAIGNHWLLHFSSISQFSSSLTPALKFFVLAVISFFFVVFQLPILQELLLSAYAYLSNLVHHRTIWAC